MESTDDSIVVDETPTGFAPADGLLAAIVVEPERSLDGWLDERRIGLREVADAAVTALALVAGLLRRPAESVAEAYGETPSPPVPESVLARAGDVRWLCEAVTEHIAAARSDDLAAAAALRAGSWSYGRAQIY